MRRHHWICIALVLVTLLIYFRAYQMIRQLRRRRYVYDNPHVRAGLTPTSMRWAFGTSDISYGPPISGCRTMLDVQLFGVSATASRMSVTFTRSLPRSCFAAAAIDRFDWRSAMVAALFAWHPLHVESGCMDFGAKGHAQRGLLVYKRSTRTFDSPSDDRRSLWHLCWWLMPRH